MRLRAAFQFICDPGGCIDTCSSVGVKGMLNQWRRLCSSSSVCFSLSNFSPASASLPAAVSC